jgi:hypothetical protein
MIARFVPVGSAPTDDMRTASPVPGLAVIPSITPRAVHLDTDGTARTTAKTAVRGRLTPPGGRPLAASPDRTR